jgi:hypothetical protein
MAEGRKPGQFSARLDKAMSALLTHEGTHAGTTEPVASAGRRPLHRIRLIIQEMNYAAKRVVELQAPWSVDRQWQSR